jgi:thioredoxin-related protein
MTRLVYPDKRFAEFSRKHIFVRVFQDTDPDGDRIANKFRVEAFPTVIVLDPSGREVRRILGFRPAPDLIEVLEGIINRGGSRISI